MFRIYLEICDQSGSGRIHFSLPLPWSGLWSFTKVIRMIRSRWRSAFRFWIELRCGWFQFLYFLLYRFLSTSQPLFCDTNIEQLSSIDFFGWTVGSNWFDPVIVRSIPQFNDLKEIWFVSILNFIPTCRMVPD